MAKAGDEVGAPVPFGAVLRVGVERLRMKEQQVPEDHRPALVERIDQVVRLLIGLDRPPGHDEGIERADVVIVQPGEVAVGEGREKMRPLARHALPHGAAECRLRPAADAAARRRGDVGAVERAERRRYRSVAGVVGAARSGVADVAIADCSELPALVDQGLREGRARWRLDHVDDRLLRSPHEPAHRQPDQRHGRQNDAPNPHPPGSAMRRRSERTLAAQPQHWVGDGRQHRSRVD